MSLERFVAAQDPVWPSVVAELRAGRKQSHWMWFVFPQIAGLGRSPMAQRYALASVLEAADYSWLGAFRPGRDHLAAGHLDAGQAAAFDESRAQLGSPAGKGRCDKTRLGLAVAWCEKPADLRRFEAGHMRAHLIGG